LAPTSSGLAPHASANKETTTVMHHADLARLETLYALHVAAIAGRTFGRAVDPALLRRYAADAIGEIARSEVRLTAFVSELALRAVRDAVEGAAAPAGDRGEDAATPGRAAGRTAGHRHRSQPDPQGDAWTPTDSTI
jgi:poly-gamma-glutamate capsule biosynthesis protein CapA/YwtB (metallophosphatase superfamily)